MKKNITLIFVIILFFTSFCVNLNAEEQSLVLYHHDKSTKEKVK